MRYSTRQGSLMLLCAGLALRAATSLDLYRFWDIADSDAISRRLQSGTCCRGTLMV